MIYTEIWQSLETSSVTGGYVRRRVKQEAVCGIFLAVARPSNKRMLHIQMTEISPPPQSSLPSARGFDVTMSSDEIEQGSFRIQLALKDSRFANIFDALINDIVDVLAYAPSQLIALRNLISRLRRWQKFLEQIGPDGLSREAQQGLYGELWFLREHLISLTDHYQALQAWIGPTHAHHDFLLHSRAIEVKTTGTKEPQYMTIHSERQLDGTGLEALFLFHIAVDIRRGAGESLIGIIESLREILKIDAAALALYEDRLLEAGFLQVHATQYEEIGYYVRRTNFFQVKDTFPRIIEADLKPGVGSVRYSISVAECRHFAIASDEFKLQLTGLNHGK